VTEPTQECLWIRIVEEYSFVSEYEEDENKADSSLGFSSVLCWQ